MKNAGWLNDKRSQAHNRAYDTLKNSLFEWNFQMGPFPIVSCAASYCCDAAARWNDRKKSFALRGKKKEMIANRAARAHPHTPTEFRHASLKTTINLRAQSQTIIARSRSLLFLSSNRFDSTVSFFSRFLKVKQSRRKCDISYRSMRRSFIPKSFPAKRRAQETTNGIQHSWLHYTKRNQIIILNVYRMKSLEVKRRDKKDELNRFTHVRETAYMCAISGQVQDLVRICR